APPVPATRRSADLNSASCTTTFTVNDTTPPSVSCPAGTSASADGTCQGVVPNVLGGVTVSDNCSGAAQITVSQSPAAGTLVGLGPHTITVTAGGGGNNSAGCTTAFTVNDTTPPSVSCPPWPTAPPHRSNPAHPPPTPYHLS